MCALDKDMECNMQHVEKALQQQTPHGSLIYKQLAVFRQVPPQQTSKYECMCTFVAFGTSNERTLLLSCLMYALQPELLYSAYVKTYESKEYETILLLKKKISVDFLEQFLGLFRMSTCVIPFETLMSDEMTTSIARIHVGTKQYGNFHCKTNANIRRKYYYKRQKNRKLREMQHVLEVTGMPYSIDNMIRLYHELTVSRCENAGLRARINNYQERVAALRI
jgi:hypothetical protein